MTDQPIRLLLVDDNPVFLTMAKGLFEEEAGVVVAGVARHGDEAIEQARLLAPDLIIMDIAMPGMSGIEATRVLKARPRAPRIVVVTVGNEPLYEQAAREAGAEDFVAKADLVSSIPRIVAECRAGRGAGPEGGGR